MTAASLGAHPALLGARSGRRTWLGWSDEMRRGPWHLAVGIEAALGTADASRPAVVEDYGTVVAGAWRAEAAREGESLRASLPAHQPPRTERVRIRLCHGEGMVRERRGREIRVAAKLNGADGWSLAFTRVRHPGHDREREAEERIPTGWWISW